MERGQSLPSAEWSPRRRLLSMDLAQASSESIVDAIGRLLSATNLGTDELVVLLGNALVVEALRPHWGPGRTADDAHRRLRTADPELAGAVEALAPMLLGRAVARTEGQLAVAAIQDLLGPGPGSQPDVAGSRG